MSKYRIRIFSSFSDSANCKTVYERLCETELMDNYGEDKEIYITNSDDYTHAIIMNTAMPELNIPKENVVGLAFEPPFFIGSGIAIGIDNYNFSQFVDYAKQKVGKYFIGSIDNLEYPFLEHYSYMWHITIPKTIPIKNRMMSIMVSEKIQAPGHKYRHYLVKEILKTNLNIDIYGRGCSYYSHNSRRLRDSRIKGEFIDNELYEPYHFHICIENFQTPSYVSEKYTNCVLWGTTPIYWGATKINSMFESVDTIILTGDIEKDMLLLTSIMYNPLEYKKEINQEDFRPKINILKNLDDIFSV